MRIHDIASENRPRERLARQGVSVLSDAELLAIILQKGSFGENVIDVSNKLISKYGLDKLNSLSVNELMKIRGIGMAKACKIIATFEISKRANAGKINDKVIKNSSDIAHYYMEKMKDYKKEYFIAVFLDSKNKIIKDEIISIGTLDSSLVHPREIFKEAIRNSAAGIILVHNHPSGDCEASEEDKQVAKKVKKAGDIIKIKVLDHIIISRNRIKSFS